VLTFTPCAEEQKSKSAKGQKCRRAKVQKCKSAKGQNCKSAKGQKCKYEQKCILLFIYIKNTKETLSNKTL
jgi:hypothetical protein